MKSVAKTVLLFFFCFSIAANSGETEENQERQDDNHLLSNTRQYFYEPYPIASGTNVLQLGLSITIMPLPLVETEIPSPSIDLQYKYGFIDNICLIGSLSTNIFSNILHFGIQLNSASERFSYGIANHIGGFAGFLSIEGQFDNNTAWAVYYLPLFRIGYRADDFSVSMAVAATYIFKSVSKVSELEAAGPGQTWNDFYVTLAIEQPFLKNSLLSLGLSLTYSKTPHHSWMLFNTIDNYLFLPELFFAVQL